MSAFFPLQVSTRDDATPAHLVSTSFSNTYTTNLVKAGGDEEFQGCTTLTFVKPDGSGELGEQCEFNATRFATKLETDPVSSTQLKRHGFRACPGAFGSC